MRAIAEQSVFRCRSSRAVVAVMCGLVALLPRLAVAQVPSITVTGGSAESVPGTYASGTYATVTVSGTGAAGERSTLTIDAPLQMGDESSYDYQVLSVTDGGLVNVNANVTAATYRSGTVGSGGTLNLLSGTFQLGSMQLSGTAAFQRAPGAAWAIDSLSLSDGATVAYTAGDMWGVGGGYTYLGISTGATLELQANLVAPEGAEIFLSGSGSRILRSAGTETITGGSIYVMDGASLALIAGDTPDSLIAGELYGTDPVAPSEIMLVPGTTTLNLTYLGLGRGGSIVGLDGASYTATTVSVTGQQLDYRLSDSITAYAGIGASGTLSLQKNLTLEGSSAELSMRGSTSTLERNGFGVSTPTLHLQDGASLTLGDGIAVSRGMILNDGLVGAPTVVTLSESLVLAASDGASPSISVSGSNASILRASPGLTITATGAEINTYEQGAFTMEDGDDFTGSRVHASNGGIIVNSGSQTLASVLVYSTDFDTGSPSTYTANAPLTITGDAFGNGLDVSDGGVFTANANVTASNVFVTSGTLNLVSGTLAASEFFGVWGSTASVTRAPGAVISAPTAAVQVSGLAAFTMEGSDTFTGAALLVAYGGTAANAGPQSLAQVYVYGKDFDTNAAATYTANAPLVITGSNSYIAVRAGGVFRANANVTSHTNVSVSNGALDLVSGTFTVGKTLTLSGSDAGLTRAAGTVLSATGATITVSSTASAAFLGGDRLSSATVNVQSGGIVTSSGSQSVGSIAVSGSGIFSSDGSVNAAVVSAASGGRYQLQSGTLKFRNSMTLSGSDAFSRAAGTTLQAGPDAELYVNDGATLPIVAADAIDAYWVEVNGGTLDLLSGTFTVSDTLSVDGTMLVNRAGGAAYAVGGLGLSNGASLDFNAATDSIASWLNLNGGFLTTTGSGGLALDFLTIGNDGLLTLDSFSSAGGPANWGLKLPSSFFGTLSAYVSGSSIVGGPGQTLNVVQQDGFAYVTAVPEPSAVVLALGGVGIAAGLLQRRSRAGRRRQVADMTSGAVER